MRDTPIRHHEQRLQQSFSILDKLRLYDTTNSVFTDQLRPLTDATCSSSPKMGVFKRFFIYPQWITDFYTSIFDESLWLTASLTLTWKTCSFCPFKSNQHVCLEIKETHWNESEIHLGQDPRWGEKYLWTSHIIEFCNFILFRVNNSPGFNKVESLLFLPLCAWCRQSLTTRHRLSARVIWGQTSNRHESRYSFQHCSSILIKLGHNGRRKEERISYGKEVASLSSQYNSEGRNFLIGWDPIVFDLHK